MGRVFMPHRMFTETARIRFATGTITNQILLFKAAFGMNVITVVD